MPNHIPRFYYGHGEEIDPTVANQLKRFAETTHLEAKAVDEGIGAYEFWGAPGFDSRLALEITSPDYQFYISFPGCTLATAIERIEEVSEYFYNRAEGSACLGHSEISGTFVLKVEDCQLELNTKTGLIIGATLTYVWEEI